MKQPSVKPEELTSIRALALELGYQQTTLWRWIVRSPQIKVYRISKIMAVNPAEVKRELAKLEASGKTLGYAKKDMLATPA